MNTNLRLAKRLLILAKQLVQSAAGVHVEVSGLPAVLQKALREVGYGKRSIELIPATEFSAQGSGGGAGKKDLFVMVDLAAGTYKVQWGSWGGANMFNTNVVDQDGTSRPLEDGIAVIKGVGGGGEPVWARIFVNPSTLAPMLPAASEQLTPEEQLALNLIGELNSKGRKDEFDRTNEPPSPYDPKPPVPLGRYGADNPHIQSLAAKGLVTISGSGAIALTIKGKNARTRR